MADILAQFGTDEKKEVDGIWKDFSGGFRFLIAAWENPDMLEEIEGMGADLSPEEDREKSDGVLARTVIKGWEPFEYDGQKAFSYSPENALKILQDRRLLPLKKRIIRAAKTEANYKLQFKAAAAKN